MDKTKQNIIKLELDEKVYPLEAIYSAGFMFIDNFYIFLDSKKKGKIEVTIKGKKNSMAKKEQTVEDDFANELMYNSARITVANRNKKIREYIVGRALFSAAGGNAVSDASIKKSKNSDSLGIMASPDKKSKKKKKKSAKK